MDDLIRESKDINCMRAGCIKLDYVVKGKQLEAHPDKSGFLVFGSNKFKAKAEHDIFKAPVMMGSIVMTEKKSENT